MNHNFCEAWHKETHVDLLAPRQPIAALEQARQTERLASVNAGIFKKMRNFDRDVAAAHYYQTLLDDLAKARAKVAQLEKEFPDKDNAGISSTDINGLKVRNVIKKGSGSQRNSGATPLSPPTASLVEFLQESSAGKNLD
ncbi:hypothetical protein [Pseudomonas sp. MPC6]|uniref:hypothetical protein n=1 Tax=unclassified Pseudomonas TaxID=196821 RepID=UPI001110A8BA|nr:hypothetical protein [Pseudomonas sp. MPC6]QCY13898.1 hypothetical protein ELQ88_25730 [Pseudomonas sp. MPC6]